MIGGLTGAAGLSQFPEFSQQYLQRLAGQVDELSRQVKDFDQTALADGMGREDMLEAMAETPLVEGQVVMWRTTFARHARLTENLMILRDATPLQRLTLPHRMADAATVQAVWDDFTPAMPLNTAGVAATGAGFLAGWMIFGGLVGGVMMPWRGRKPHATPTPKRQAPRAKVDPPVARPTLVAQIPDNRPRLAGVQR